MCDRSSKSCNHRALKNYQNNSESSNSLTLSTTKLIFKINGKKKTMFTKLAYEIKLKDAYISLYFCHEIFGYTMIK